MNLYFAELGIVKYQSIAHNKLTSQEKVTQKIIYLLTDSQNSAELDLLNKIKNSIKLINQNMQVELDQLDLLENHNNSKMIVFSNKKFEDTQNILYASSLQSLLSNPDLKKTLWQQMQQFCV